MEFKGIIALAKNRVIGDKGGIPWNMPSDLKFFKETTWNGHVIMGRKTWESMPRFYLPNRNLWVLTKKNAWGWQQMDYDKHGLTYSIRIIEDSQRLPDLTYFVAGGLSIYQHFLPRISEFLVTYLRQDYAGDTVMPPFEDGFNKAETVLQNSDFEIKRFYEKKLG